jgi:hypothetical protein
MQADALRFRSGLDLLADVRSLTEHLLDGAFHKSSQAQVLDRGMQKRCLEIDRKVMTPPVLAKVEHATLFKTLDDPPYLAFCTPDRPGDLFRSAVRAEGNVEQDVSLGREEGPVDSRRRNGVRLTDASVSLVLHCLPATSMREYLLRSRLGLGLC